MEWNPNHIIRKSKTQTKVTKKRQGTKRRGINPRNPRRKRNQAIKWARNDLFID